LLRSLKKYAAKFLRKYAAKFLRNLTTVAPHFSALKAGHFSTTPWRWMHCILCKIRWPCDDQHISGTLHCEYTFEFTRYLKHYCFTG